MEVSNFSCSVLSGLCKCYTGDKAKLKVYLKLSTLQISVKSQ